MTLEALMDEIRALPTEQRKLLIGMIVDSLTLPTDESAEKQYDILDFEGVGAEMWQGIDAQEYVNRLRDEWDQPREG